MSRSSKTKSTVNSRKKKNASGATSVSISSKTRHVVCPYTDQKVFVAKATLQDLKTIVKNNTNNKQKRLWTIASATIRQEHYLQVAQALALVEQDLLPSYGGRSWEVSVTLSEPNGGRVLFRAYKGKMELAVLPHLLERIPEPPAWSGKRCGQPPDEYQAMQGDEEAARVKDYISSLTMREVSTLSTVAYEVLRSHPHNYPIPQVTTKWKSPDAQTFTSRKTAWEYAEILSKQEVCINRNILGVGASGKLLQVFIPSLKTTLEVGKLRFIRDGLWVVGQELAWQEARPDQWQEQQQELAAAPKVYTSGLQLYVATYRQQYKQKHGNTCSTLAQADMELRMQWRRLSPNQQQVWNRKVQEQFESSSSVSNDDSGNCSGQERNSDSNGSDEEEPRIEYVSPLQFFVQQRRHDYRYERQMELNVNKFTLAQADRELRAQWKEMTKQEQDEWITKLGGDDDGHDDSSCCDTDANAKKCSPQADKSSTIDDCPTETNLKRLDSNGKKSEEKIVTMNREIANDAVQITDADDGNQKVEPSTNGKVFAETSIQQHCNAEATEDEQADANAKCSLQADKSSTIIDCPTETNLKRLDSNGKKSEEKIVKMNREIANDAVQITEADDGNQKVEPSANGKVFAETSIQQHRNAEATEDEQAIMVKQENDQRYPVGDPIQVTNVPPTPEEATTIDENKDVPAIIVKQEIGQKHPAGDPIQVISMPPTPETSSAPPNQKEQSKLEVNFAETMLDTKRDSPATISETASSSHTRRVKQPPSCVTRRWCMKPDQIALCHDACMEHFETVMRTVKTRDLARELADGFDVLRERGRGRFDMELPAFDTSTFSFLNDFKKTPWMTVVRAILGEEVVLIHKGCFLSLPGAEAQVYHQDGVHLNNQSQQPCHAINVFVPLVDLHPRNGPTEFVRGSHVLGHDGYDRDFLETPKPKAGTPLIFDYRLGHRGLANSSHRCRPIVYCTYARAKDGKEFRDQVNFSRRRYHKIGELAVKPLSREERRKKRKSAVVDLREEAELRKAMELSAAQVNLEMEGKLESKNPDETESKAVNETSTPKKLKLQVDDKDTGEKTLSFASPMQVNISTDSPDSKIYDEYSVAIQEEYR